MHHNTLTIDNVTFAQKQEKLAGELPLKDCARLTELLATEQAADAAIQYTLQGSLNSVRQPMLNLLLRAQLSVVCQRCLEPMPLEVSREFNYLITDVEEDALEDVDDIDFQEPSINMDIQALIEDEIIVALPIAPVHNQPCGPETMESGEKANPFAALKDLIKPKG